MVLGLIAMLGAADAVVTTLSQIALWQRKEYRIDRMSAYLDSPEGSLVRQKNTLLLGALLAAGWASSAWVSFESANMLGLAGLIGHLAGHGVRIVRRGVIRPDATARVRLIGLLSLITSIVWVSFGISWEALPALTWATFIFSIPAIVALCIGLSAIPVFFKKQSLIARAHAYRKTLKGLTVVGITGSVGKTSAKTYALHLLGGTSEKIQATDKHRNAPYPIAKDIFTSLTPKTKVYIAEMAAYRKGEIAKLANFLEPAIGVITAITNQHASLFGSVEALADAKWELAESLPDDGILILNKDDAQIVRKAKKESRRIIWYSMQDSTADVYASDIAILPEKVTCRLRLFGVEQLAEIPVIGRGQISSALAAIAVACELGTKPALIEKRLEVMPSLPRTMEFTRHSSGAAIIDDSYSASEASVINAIEYMSALQTKDNRFVLVPIIELGVEASNVHTKIGSLLAPLSARVYIYGDAYQKDILRGLGKKPKADVVWISDPRTLAEKVSEHMTEDTSIVLEGRVPNIVRERIL